LPFRRSCRNFSDKKLAVDQIGSICHYAYSIKDHAVPSGGALYPLKIYVLIENDQEDIRSGYYEYDAENDELVLFNKEVDKEQLKYCYNQEEMPFGSSVQIVIAADLKRQPFKYSNRGYMLTMIEVGHVAENISLYCAEQNIGACEMGGIQDEPLKRELGLDDIWPIISVSVGYKSNKEKKMIDKIRYVEEKTGKEKPVKKFWTNVFGNDGSFFGATAVYENNNGDIQYSGATSPSYADAIFKAVIEGYERWMSGQVRTDFYGSAQELKNWVNPQLFFPLTKEQTEKCGVTQFLETLSINWTIGKKSDNSNVFVPSDIVYYGQKTGKNRIYFGHSSGIAAYSSLAEAQKRALVELIERDALMRNWYSRKAPDIIDESILPIHAKKRIEYWKGQGRRAIFLKMPSKYGWVIETIIVSDEYPFFVSGAAATIDKNAISATIYKSLQEAEYSLLLCKNFPDESEIDPKSVSTPTDHGKIYHIKKYAKTLEWLWGGRRIFDFGDFPLFSIDELLATTDAITVDLSEGRESDLAVVRVLSPKLVPINFGFDSAHYTHPELIGKVHPESLKMPHYFV
jgi:thiazole/oxazole-forming peptide maturase SagD family component